MAKQLDPTMLVLHRKFVLERESIRVKKEAGLAKPWTADKILQSYSFCNMAREDDRVTRWIAQNWREPMAEAESPNLWFWMLVARVINWPDTLAELTSMALSNDYDPEAFKNIVRNRMTSNLKAWGGAYIVSTNGHALDKEVYIAHYVLEAAWKQRELIEPDSGDTLKRFCERLMTLNGVSGFMAGQVIADAKYADPYLMEAPDWFTFGISGPGSRRGLNRVCGIPKDTSWKELEWHDTLMKLREELLPHLVGTRLENLHAQDLQNTLCEFDKYERTFHHEGRPRATYQGV